MAMTVRELIAILRTYPPDMVCVQSRYSDYADHGGPQVIDGIRRREWIESICVEDRSSMLLEDQNSIKQFLFV